MLPVRSKIHSLLSSTLCALVVSTALHAQLTYGSATAGSISPAGEVDVYSFPGEAGDAIVILASRTSGSFDLQPCIELRDAGGALVASACVRTSSNRVDVTLQSTGTHSIFVSDQTSVLATGGYTLALERVAAAPSPGCVVLDFGQTAAGGIGPAGEIDCYSFHARAGAPVRLVASRASGSFDFQPCIEVFAPDGTPGGQACARTNTNSLDYTTTTAGVHVVLISDQRSVIAGGGYSLSLQCLAASCRPPASYTTFGTGCAAPGGAAPVLAAAPGSLPTVGSTFDLRIRSGQPVLASWMLVGFRQVSIPLAAIGAGSCDLLVTPAFSQSLGQSATWRFTIPVNPALNGLTFYNQGVLLAPGANPLGLTFSNGGEGVIG